MIRKGVAIVTRLIDRWRKHRAWDRDQCCKLHWQVDLRRHELNCTLWQAYRDHLTPSVDGAAHSPGPVAEEAARQEASSSPPGVRHPRLHAGEIENCLACREPADTLTVPLPLTRSEMYDLATAALGYAQNCIGEIHQPRWYELSRKTRLIADAMR